jgi:hypothetical protein
MAARENDTLEHTLSSYSPKLELIKDAEGSFQEPRIAPFRCDRGRLIHDYITISKSHLRDAKLKHSNVSSRHMTDNETDY